MSLWELQQAEKAKTDSSSLTEAKTILTTKLIETIRNPAKSVKTKIAQVKSITETAKELGEAVKTYEELPKKVTVDMPIFSEKIPFTDIEVKNILPFGFLIPSQFGSKELAEPDYVALVEEGTKPKFIYEPVLEPYRTGEPEKEEIKVTPNPFLEDKLEFGEDIPIDIKEKLVKNYPEEKYQVPGVPPIQYPEIKLPDLGEIGKWLLLGGAGLIAILLLTRK